MLVCVFSFFARETADAARIRHSPRPQGAEVIQHTSGAARRENEIPYLDWPSIGRHCEGLAPAARPNCNSRHNLRWIGLHYR
jgi:hypothetical protein